MEHFCPCCGSQDIYKKKDLAQLIFSCKVCQANFLIIVTTQPKISEPSGLCEKEKIMQSATAFCEWVNKNYVRGGNGYVYRAAGSTYNEYKFTLDNLFEFYLQTKPKAQYDG